MLVTDMSRYREAGALVELPAAATEHRYLCARPTPEQTCAWRRTSSASGAVRDERNRGTTG